MSQTAQHILSRVQGLERHLQKGETPLIALPTLWDNHQTQKSTPCTLIITNQRIIGYEWHRFPRERLFLESLKLEEVQKVTQRKKSFEAFMRELEFQSNNLIVSVRTSRKQIDRLLTTLPQILPDSTNNATANQLTSTYTNEAVQRSFTTSPLGLGILLTLGIIMEVAALYSWQQTGDAQIGTPLFIGGLICVFVAFFTRRRVH